MNLFRASRRISGILLDLIASAVLLALMLLTFTDVLSRNIFSQPLRGTFELTELLLATLIFTGLPLVARADEHIRVDVIALPFRGWLARFVEGVVQFSCGIILGCVAYLLWQRADRFTEYGDHTYELAIPIGPFLYGMALLTLITGLIHIRMALQPTKSNPAERVGS